MTTPIVCRPDAIPENQRDSHAALTQTLFKQLASGHSRVEGGFRFEFSSADYEKVVRYVQNERLCCPFIHFLVEITPNSGPVTLMISGPEGTQEFIGDAMGLS